MPIGPHVPEWEQLFECLSDLALSTGASAVCVFDAWVLPWCCAPVHDITIARDAARILRRALAALEKPLEHGGSLDRVCGAHDSGSAYVRSFASVYVLILRYRTLFDLKEARRAVTVALPRIEALVVALPPPDGPGAGSAQALVKA